MKTLLQRILSNAVWLGLAATTYAQTPGTDHLTIPFSDPSRPGTVRVKMLTGSILVKAYAGKEVIVDTKARDEGESRTRSRADTTGMKRIPNTTSGLTAEEDANVISISTRSFNRPVDVILQVPTRTSLNLKTVSGGEIRGEQVQGEIEVSNINGAVTLTQVSGSVIAHALNGNVKVSLAAVDSNKPMSFSSLNGDIDVSLPHDVKANLSMKSDNGEIFSDFDVKLDPAAARPLTEDFRKKGVKYFMGADRVMKGTINGGGPEIQMKTFNGNIYIRKSVP